MSDSSVDPNKLTPYQKWHLGLMGFGLLFAFATLIFVGRQVDNLVTQTERQTDATNIQRRAVQGQVWAMVTQNEVELTKVLIGNPQVLPYFQRARPISRRDRNYELVMAVADMHLSFFDSLFDEHIRTLPGMEPNGKYWTLWENYMRDSFSLSPALCARYSEVRNWFSAEIDQYAKPGCVARATSNQAVKGTLRDKAAQRPLP